MEHVILVAFQVEGETQRDAEEFLHTVIPCGLVREAGNNLPQADEREVSWWVAEDERYDRSDNDSAVFIPRTMKQEEAVARLWDTGSVTLTPDEVNALDSHLAMYVEAHTDHGHDPAYNGEPELLALFERL